MPSFTRSELQAMARLSPDRRRAIYHEVAQEASRTAYVTAEQETSLGDAGMGKSWRKRITSVVKKVVAPVKRVVNKIDDAVKRVAEKTEETVKRVSKKIPGAEAISDVGRKVQEVATRVGKATQKTAKEVARKAAPLLAIAMPLSLGVKSIRKNAAKFYRKHGVFIVTAAGAILAPFTGGISVAVASLLVAGKMYADKLKAAKEAERAGKAEAAQMAAAVVQQEAALNAQCDEVYASAPDTFAAIGITPEIWASLPVDEKLRIIEDLSNGKIPNGYALTDDVKRKAEEERLKAENDQLDDLYVKHQSAMEGAGYPPDQWYSMTVPEKYAAFDSLSAEIPSQEVTSGGSPTTSQPTIPSTPGVTSPDIPSASGELKYQLVIEGDLEGLYSSVDEAARAAASKASKGDRVEILSPDGTSLGLAIQTASGLVPVPESDQEAVRAMTHGEIVSKVSQAAQTASQAAQTASQAAQTASRETGGFPWLLLAVPAAIFVGMKGQG